MEVNQPPTEITEVTSRDKYWLRSQEVSDDPRIAGDGYFSKHDVTQSEDLTMEDLPATEESAVREIDREALEKEKVIGKWQLTGSADTIDELWPKLIDDATNEVIWAAKAMTAFGRKELPYDEYMIDIYAPNYFEKHDVNRVREHLRTEHGIAHTLNYKPDIYTVKGIVADNVEEYGLSVAVQYRK